MKSLPFKAGVSMYLFIAMPSYIPKLQCNYTIMQKNNTLHMFKQSKIHMEHLHNHR
jgi:hypothetical protein